MAKTKADDQVGVNRTLYIPLYGKALVSRKGLLLRDPKAEEIWDREGFPLGGKAASKWLAYYMGMRAGVFDQWTARRLGEDEAAVVLHIGCGMDARALRVEHPGHRWYDVDFPQVIRERRRYFTENGDYQLLSGDAREESWLEAIPERESAVVVLEGLSMYLTPEELETLLRRLRNHFAKLWILMDCYTELAARLSRFGNPIRAVGVTQVYGLDRPESLERAGVTYVKAHSMTPEEAIAQLPRKEQGIFRKLYAGRMSKKLYRIYEYRAENL